MTFPEMEAHNPAHTRCGSEDKWATAAPSGESYAEVGRAAQACGTAGLPPTLVVVAHGGTMRALMVTLGHLDAQEASETRIDPGCRLCRLDNNGLEKFG